VPTRPGERPDSRVHLARLVTASDLMLALWRRRDPLAFHVDGPRGMLERWPSI
jgi:hypothetical protein